MTLDHYSQLPKNIQKILQNPDSIKKELAERRLVEFIKQGWHVLEPSNPYVHGWHIDAICEHLEAVSTGEIKRLLINVPPGTMKSLCVGVFFPAWEFIKKPHLRFLGTAYKQDLASRDNAKCRTLILSDWYQNFWGLELKSDQNAKLKFETKQLGFRAAMAIGSLTGERGDRVLLDDPHSVDSARSNVSRDGVLTTFKESLGSRLCSPLESAIIVTMQRLHTEDVSGYILKKELGYTHLCLPMEFEPKRKCYTSIGFEDPRTFEGELLFPERFPLEVVKREKELMDSRATAGQYQQSPAPADGNIFKESDFKWFTTARKYKRIIISWDTAQKANQLADPSVATVWGDHDSGFDLLEVFREKMEYPRLKKEAIKLAEKYHSDQELFKGHKLLTVLIEDKSSGQSLIQDLKHETNFNIVAILPQGDKIIRASTCSPKVESGKVFLKTGASWVQDYIDEMITFPNSSNDDQVDSTSQFLNWIAGGKSKITEHFF